MSKYTDEQLNEYYSQYVAQMRSEGLAENLIANETDFKTYFLSLEGEDIADLDLYTQYIEFVVNNGGGPEDILEYHAWKEHTADEREANKLIKVLEGIINDDDDFKDWKVNVKE